MKSRFLTWILFCLGLSVPAALLGGVTYEAGCEKELTRRESQWNRRIASAAELRSDVELASREAQRALMRIPQEATPGEMTEHLRDIAEAEVFTLPFYAIQEQVVVVGAPTADEKATLEAELANDRSLLVMRDNAIPPYSADGFSFTFSREHQMMVRRLQNGNRVGIVTTPVTALRGATRVLEHREKDRPAAEQLRVEPWPESWGEKMTRDIPTKPDAVLISVSGSLPVWSGGDREALASLTIGNFLRLHVLDRDPEGLTRSIRMERIKVWLVGLACITVFIGVAAMFLKRSLAAKRLADLRTDFVASVSHELRTPLASVRMFAELLEAGDVPEEERPEVEQALAGETRRLHATLDRMLRFGALARGKLVIEKKVQALAPIAKEAAGKRDVRFDVPDDLIANVDGGMLGLALDNLLSNAVKYAPDGGPYVVRAREDGDHVVISVLDRGPGLSKKAQTKVFLPFERADSRLSKATDGSGVGLALVRGIAQAHGGDATVTSDVGHGATFTLRLPRA